MLFYALMSPAVTILVIYILAAILPAVFLMCYIYSQDKYEPEPGNLLWSLVLSGVAAALVSILLESVGETVLSKFVSEDSPDYSIILAFLVVAVVEEGTKFFFLKRKTWNNPNFNFRYDGVVYAVFVSLGFAAFENVEYVFRYGLSVVASRALLAIPAHMGFAVFMGSFYGRAKICEARGDRTGKTLNLLAGYLVAVFLHGFYDSTAMIGTSQSMWMFVAFVIIMYIVVYNKIKSESRNDKPIY